VNTEEKLHKLDEMQEFIAEVRLLAHRDIILCVHFLMHQKRHAEAMMLLCPCASLLEGTDVPENVGEAFAAKLNAIILERIKSDCEGTG
jgi:hypothetical protein